MPLMLSCKIISPVHTVEQGKTGRKQNSETQIKLIRSSEECKILNLF